MIKTVLPNQYINSRRSLNSILKVKESPGLNFFYVDGNYPLDPLKYKVGLSKAGRSPRLLTTDGKDPVLLFVQLAGATVLRGYNNIILKFEGGLGDYMDQADVVAQLQREHPLKKFDVLIAHPTRQRALQMIDGFSKIEFHTNEKKLGGHHARIDMSRIDQFRGYAPNGKIGVYSAIAGLPSTAPRSKINFTLEQTKAGMAIIQEKCLFKKPFIVILHTVSGNANTKSLPAATVLEILEPFFTIRKALILHLGGAGETKIDHPKILSLQGKLPWEKVFALMGVADACVCIDSAIMHIAQHLPLPTLSFWGPTDPENILGVDPGIDILRSTAPCRGCGQWQCKKIPCMEKFNNAEVAAAVSKLYSF